MNINIKGGKQYMNNNFFKHIKSQSINMSSTLETAKKEGFRPSLIILHKYDHMYIDNIFLIQI